MVVRDEITPYVKQFSAFFVKSQKLVKISKMLYRSFTIKLTLFIHVNNILKI